MGKHRLNNSCYVGIRIYSVTICTHHKDSYFINREVVEMVKGTLLEIAERNNFNIEVFCFMLNHLHLLVSGKNEDSNLKKFIYSFKQKTGCNFRKKKKQNLWQEGYYDHILRKDEIIGTVAKYILGNPERKGLVKNYTEYPFIGSETFDIRNL